MPPRKRAALGQPRRLGAIEAFTKSTKPGISSSDPKTLKRKGGEEIIVNVEVKTNGKRRRLEDTRTIGSSQQLPSPRTTPIKSEDSALPSTLDPTPSKASKLQAHERAKNNLIQLHRSLLRSLSLHLAHHGTSSPVRLSELLPSASKSWGSRRITVEDVQRCLALYDKSSPPIRIWDYGRAGICLELSAATAQGPTQGRAVLASAIDESAMCNVLENSLESAWKAWRETENDAGDFVGKLWLAKITQHPSLLKSRTASVNLGQQRLDELFKTPRKCKEQGLVEKISEDTPSSSGLSTPLGADSEPCTPSSRSLSLLTPTTTPHNTPRDRKLSLYARLATKSRASSNTTSATTSNNSDPKAKYTTTQISALSRLPSIITILTALSLSSGGRQAFSLLQLVRKVKESSQSVMEEAVIREAVGLLGGVRLDEKGRIVHGPGENGGLAPEFVKIVKIGEGVVGVVIVAGGRPKDLEERVRRALGTR